MTIHFPKSHTQYRSYTNSHVRKVKTCGGIRFSKYCGIFSSTHVSIESAKFTNLDIIFKKQSKVKQMLNRLKNLVV